MCRGTPALHRAMLGRQFSCNVQSKVKTSQILLRGCLLARCKRRGGRRALKVTGRFSSTDKRQFGPLRWARSKKARRAARRRHRQWKLETHAYWKHRLSAVHKLRCAWQQCDCERKPRQRRDGGRTTNDAVAAAHDRGSGSSGSGRNRYWKPRPHPTSRRRVDLRAAWQPRHMRRRRRATA